MEDSKLLLKTLIILCRNPDNIPLVSSMSFLQLITQMDSLLLNHLLQMESMFFGGGRGKAKAIQAQTQKLRGEIMEFIGESCHLLECIYDPYFRWRVFLFGKDHEKGRQKTGRLLYMSFCIKSRWWLLQNNLDMLFVKMYRYNEIRVQLLDIPPLFIHSPVLGFP